MLVDADDAFSLATTARPIRPIQLGDPPSAPRVSRARLPLRITARCRVHERREHGLRTRALFNHDFRIVALGRARNSRGPTIAAIPDM